MLSTLSLAGFGERSNLKMPSEAPPASVAFDLLEFERRAVKSAPSVVHSLREDSWLSPKAKTCNFLNISHDGFRRRAGSSPLDRARASSSRQ